MLKKTLIAVGALAGLATVGIAASGFTAGVDSGLKTGEMVTPFHPMHVAGPDKGTDTCPPCKYGNRPAVQIWVNQDSEENIAGLAKHLNKQVANSDEDLKGFMIMLTKCEACVDASKMFAGKAEKMGMKNIGIAHLSNQDKAVKNYKVNIDSEVKNTVFVYVNRKVVKKFVNLKADEAGLAQLDAAINMATAAN